MDPLSCDMRVSNLHHPLIMREGEFRENEVLRVEIEKHGETSEKK